VKEIGEFSWLLAFDEADERMANARARAAASLLRSLSPEGLVEAIPAARTLYVEGNEKFDPGVLVGLEAGSPDAPPPAGRSHEIRVTFDGEDLPEVSAALGLAPAGFEEAFLATSFTVGFLGFSPGFAYLYGLPRSLQLPRRRTPRLSVPAQSLAMAGPYVGIYPAAMPGGWSLLGWADARPFDVRRSPPTLFSPGDTVRFGR
jgi:KipI family sensor histidine kinase inhibitor